MPPGPVSVTSRVVWSLKAARIAASSVSRPISGVRGIGIGAGRNAGTANGSRPSASARPLQPHSAAPPPSGRGCTPAGAGWKRGQKLPVGSGWRCRR